jgi:uncharacterized protein YuzE
MTLEYDLNVGALYITLTSGKDCFDSRRWR